MRNSLQSQWLEPEAPTYGWLDHPGQRLRVLLLIFLLPSLAIGYRLVQLQVYRQAEFTRVFEATTTRIVEIPARNGRILASDGSLLAVDEENFELWVHYRWLEEPPHPDWLKRQANSRLSRRQRRDDKQVAAMTTTLLDERRQQWERIARITGVSKEELDQARQSVQTRIERMKQAVLEKQNQQQPVTAQLTRSIQPARSIAEESSPHAMVAWLGWGQKLWQEFQHELTTPPPRAENGPLILAEELDAQRVLDTLPKEAADEILAHPELYPGLEVRVRHHRTYPARQVASHLLGVRTPLREEEALERARQWPQGDPLDYRTGDAIGRSGLELAYDAQLRGLRGLKRLTLDRRGQIVEEVMTREVRHGADLYLSLDVEVQRTAEALLEQALLPDVIDAPGDSPTQKVDDSTKPARSTTPQGGSVVVIDVRTGQVIAAASAPGYDANVLTNPSATEWAQLTGDVRRPLYQRVTRMALAPGSTFKPLTAIAGLEAGMKAQSAIECAGYLDQPQRDRCLIFRHYGVGHGSTDLSDALCQSCNVYFFKLARMLGPNPLVEQARQFGFGQLTGIDLPFEQAGHLPSPQTNSTREPWYPGDTLGLAIGQSRLQVTPLQMARFMAAIANGGELLTPRLKTDQGPLLVTSFSETSGETTRTNVRKPALAPQTLQEVRHGLYRVVNDAQGTAYKTVRLKEVEICGKTGTAEAGSGVADHAWFAGYAPASQPRYAIVVVLEHGGSGGKEAGPIAREVIRRMHQLGLIPSGSLAKNKD